MKISVLGCGRWATFIAWYLNKINHDVLIWGRESSKNILQLKKFRKNNFLNLNDKTIITSNINEAINFSNIIVISISSQMLRSFLNSIKEKFNNLKNKTFILCMKGIEKDTGKRLSVVLKECLGENSNIAVWVGPGHVQDFVNNIPNCMVIDSENDSIKNNLIKEFSSNLIRFYYGNDIIGIEIGAATKNIIGIAAGILDGLGYTSLKGALMSRGTREISRLICALGGKEQSAYSLAHLGDYEATLFSPYSNNRLFGECLVKSKEYNKLAEGVATSYAVKIIKDKIPIDLPICESVYDILNGDISPKESVDRLFLRNLKTEF